MAELSLGQPVKSAQLFDEATILRKEEEKPLDEVVQQTNSGECRKRKRQEEEKYGVNRKREKMDCVVTGELGSSHLLEQPKNFFKDLPSERQEQSSSQSAGSSAPLVHQLLSTGNTLERNETKNPADDGLPSDSSADSYEEDSLDEFTFLFDMIDHIYGDCPEMIRSSTPTKYYDEIYL